MKKVSSRRWELLIWFSLCPDLWRFHIAGSFGKGEKPFLHETWIGPLCLRVWRDPMSICHARPVRLARERFLGFWW